MQLYGNRRLPTVAPKLLPAFDRALIPTFNSYQSDISDLSESALVVYSTQADGVGDMIPAARNASIPTSSQQANLILMNQLALIQSLSHQQLLGLPSAIGVSSERASRFVDDGL